LSEPHARRLTRAYGTRIDRVLRNAETLDDLGTLFCGDLTGAEVRYLVEHEWARSAEDVLWRRSKLGLIATAEERAALDAFVAGLTDRPGAHV
jgi:glycerol-3-phosphate dehydrogenase